MAQRDLNLHRHGTGSSVTRRCPDKEIHGRYAFHATNPATGLRQLRDRDAEEDTDGGEDDA
ncbi:hypothetical protein ACWEN3_36065 [Streptomyces sp. NPDC004561]